MITGAPSILSGSGMPKDWWKKQETVHITILGQQGFILNRYLVYEVASDVRICRIIETRYGCFDSFVIERSARVSTLLPLRLPLGLFD